ncbi:GNAT family N-acetyltransferase [Pseudokineococcus lusitanus]|uniref:Ribosomal protein S18 acetylase RimI-like enzyme n=1 Tax=Pseudokineococcus lusitanus TaxID=763993 RepID=A0A3N1HQA2_9ACTN|nr:GNAT family N-acetyltransferase [Pseudokineococcus lusitanus]ROP44630.1 ribosomal protein S18 acetylase RimI-like enzyme [Pseudokineococcus lusitanus]
MSVLRPAVPDDAPALAAVHVAGWRAGYRGLVRDDYLDALDPSAREARWRTTASGPDGVLVVEEDGALVALCAFGPCRDDDLPDEAGEVRSLYVLPEHWGTGVGGRLLAAATAELLAVGADEPPVLWALTGNTRARRFYERRGWHPDGTTRVVERAELDGVPAVTFPEVRHRLTAAGAQE